MTLDAVSPGTHAILIRLSGYQDWPSQVQVTAGQTTQISATLIPVPTPTPTKSGALPLALLGALAGMAFITGRRR